MPEYLAPGVYVEEVDTGSKPIEGVSTSTTGMIGVTERGPVDVPILVTSYGEYVRWFGERLRRDMFSNGNDRHCYLPHAVQGFFDNGGKRLYVTRILDTENAARSDGFQFARGDPAAASTVLLRAAGELTGSAANLPRLIVLGAAGIADKDWVRISDGSRAEYRQADGNPAGENTLVPLARPFNRSYASGVDVRAFAPPAPGGAATLAVASPVGAETVVVQGTTADVNALAPAAPAALPLVMIGGVTGELRFVTEPRPVAVPIGGGQSRVTLHLDSPLSLAYSAGGAVQTLAVPGALADVVDTPYTAGDPLLFVVAPRDAALIPGNVIVTVVGGQNREARLIGKLQLFTLSNGAPHGYPAGTRVEEVTLQDDGRTFAVNASAGDTSVVLNSAEGLVAGQPLIVGPSGGTHETVIIRSVDSGNTVRFTAGLANPYSGANRVAAPAPKTLTAAGSAGAGFLSVDNRMGLAEKMVLRVTDGLNQEWVTITGLPGRAATPAAPDAGPVQVSPPLTLGYATAAQVFIQAAPALVAATPATYLVLDAAPGAGEVVVASDTGFAANDRLRLTAGDQVTYHTLLSLAAPLPQVLTLDKALKRSHPAGSVVIERAQLFEVQALDLGAWGDRLLISAEDEESGLAAGTELVSSGPATRIRLGSNAGVEAGTILEVVHPDTGQVIGPLLKVQSVDVRTGLVTLDGTGLDPAHDAARVAIAPRRLIMRSREFRLTVRLLRQPDPAAPSRNDAVIDTEVFRYLSMDSRHSHYLQKVIGEIGGPLRPSDRRPEGESGYIRVSDVAQSIANAANRLTQLTSIRLGPETLIDVLPDGRMRAARHELTGGLDAINTLNDAIYIGLDNPTPELRTGLQTLRNIEQISLVACPGRTSVAMQSALITHCELLRYRFAALDGPQPPNDLLPDVQTLRSQYDTKYAGIYHPWLIIPDPFPTNLANVAQYPIPPSGHVLGLIARTDIERGVHKPPANEVLRGITGLQRLLNKEQQDILNPSPVNINVIRDFRPNNRGIRVFGARVMTSDPDWKYVNVRRLLIFIEASVDRGLQWVVFEPNAPPLWARVRRSIAAFLTTVWRNGALEGRKVEEAFFVKCDETTMTQADIDNGRLIVVVGVAPVKPAEYVIIRIGLWTARAEE